MLEMNLSHWIFGAAFLVGAIQALAPDHWLPGVLWAWRRRMGFRATSLATLLLLCVHLVSAAAVYWALGGLLEAWIRPERFFLFAASLSLGFMLLRMLRFSQLHHAFDSGFSRIEGIWVVLSFLGPAETLIPFLMKSNQLGLGYLTPLAGFGAGTVLVGVTASCLGLALCDRPSVLARALDTLQRPVAMVPLAAGAALGLLLVMSLPIR